MTEVTKIDHPNAVQHHQPDAMISMIERVVMSPDADLDKLERMLAMKERMDAQNARISFARALSEARSEIPPIIKDATVDYENRDKTSRTHYKHETLAGIAKQIDPILSKWGLSYRYRTEQGNGGVKVTCIIQHSGGHSEETSLAGAPDGSGSKNSFQAVGSAVTYLQRYTLKAALGLSAEVDDDGQAAGPRPGQQRQQDDPPAFNPRAAADRLIGAIRKRKGNRDELQALWDAEKPTLEKLDDDMFAEVKGEFATAATKPQPAQVDDLAGDTIPF